MCLCLSCMCESLLRKSVSCIIWLCISKGLIWQDTALTYSCLLPPIAQCTSAPTRTTTLCLQVRLLLRSAGYQRATSSQNSCVVLSSGHSHSPCHTLSASRCLPLPPSIAQPQPQPLIRICLHILTRLTVDGLVRNNLRLRTP